MKNRWKCALIQTWTSKYVDLVPADDGKMSRKIFQSNFKSETAWTSKRCGLSISSHSMQNSKTVDMNLEWSESNRIKWQTSKKENKKLHKQIKKKKTVKISRTQNRRTWSSNFLSVASERPQRTIRIPSIIKGKDRQRALLLAMRILLPLDGWWTVEIHFVILPFIFTKNFLLSDYECRVAEVTVESWFYVERFSTWL